MSRNNLSLNLHPSSLVRIEARVILIALQQYPNRNYDFLGQRLAYLRYIECKLYLSDKVFNVVVAERLQSIGKPGGLHPASFFN